MHFSQVEEVFHSVVIYFSLLVCTQFGTKRINTFQVERLDNSFKIASWCVAAKCWNKTKKNWLIQCLQCKRILFQMVLFLFYLQPRNITVQWYNKLSIKWKPKKMWTSYNGLCLFVFAFVHSIASHFFCIFLARKILFSLYSHRLDCLCFSIAEKASFDLWPKYAF